MKSRLVISVDAVDTVEKIDPFICSWTPVKSLNKVRNQFRMVELGGYLYCLGGIIYGETLNSVERYDPKVGLNV